MTETNISNTEFQYKVEFCMSFIPIDFMNESNENHKSYQLIPIPTFLEGIGRGAEKLAMLINKFYSEKYTCIDVLNSLKNDIRASKNIDNYRIRRALELCNNELDMLDPANIHLNAPKYTEMKSRNEIRKYIFDIRNGSINFKDAIDELIDYFNKSEYYKTVAKNMTRTDFLSSIKSHLYKVMAAQQKESTYLTSIELYMNLFIAAINANFSINPLYIDSNYDIHTLKNLTRIFNGIINSNDLRHVFCLIPYMTSKRLSEKQLPFNYFKSKPMETMYNGTKANLEMFIISSFENSIARHNYIYGIDRQSYVPSSTSDESNDESSNESESSTADDSKDESSTNEFENKAISTDIEDDYLKYPKVCKKHPSKTYARKPCHRVDSTESSNDSSDDSQSSTESSTIDESKNDIKLSFSEFNDELSNDEASNEDF